MSCVPAFGGANAEVPFLKQTSQVAHTIGAEIRARETEKNTKETTKQKIEDGNLSKRK
eukprot:CAMPEP_0114547956 /NCGR_PEP_ID=MMETSP0114-20121206/4728_1 /TAXON_ID=31324 /ORGANISM="Goniomonas sp, Strain m" /LENGTH=57 /DNA_ID=CAMNT_0001732521 /DNA_START=391 /DNA_END=564 /DNA_ORIENTATION=+